MSTDEKRIREFAYQIWESEGQPDGQESRHWEMACKLAEAEALAPKKPAKASASKPPASKTTNGKAGEVKVAAAKPKAKPVAASAVVPPGGKSTEKKPRATRKPPAI